MKIETASRLSKMCTIILATGFLVTIIWALFGLLRKEISILFAVLAIVFSGVLLGLAIYQDIKNKRWNDGYKL
jgi:uncharacterized membrane protein